MAIVVVSYQYSTSSDRVLNRKATWKGRVLGRSLATVMSELRRMHCCATNIAITDIEWRDDPGTDEGAPDGGAGPGNPHDRLPYMAMI